MPWNRQRPWLSPAQRVPPPSDIDVAVERVLFHAAGGAIQRCPPAYAAPVHGLDIDPEAPKPAETPPPRPSARPAPPLSPSEQHALDILRRALVAGPVTVAAWREACRGDGGLSPGSKPNSRSQIANRSMRALEVKRVVEVVDGMARPSDLRAVTSHTAGE